jgi:hypothetical protein
MRETASPGTESGTHPTPDGTRPTPDTHADTARRPLWVVAGNSWARGEAKSSRR